MYIIWDLEKDEVWAKRDYKMGVIKLSEIIFGDNLVYDVDHIDFDALFDVAVENLEAHSYEVYKKI